MPGTTFGAEAIGMRDIASARQYASFAES